MHNLSSGIVDGDVSRDISSEMELYPVDKRVGGGADETKGRFGQRDGVADYAGLLHWQTMVDCA